MGNNQSACLRIRAKIKILSAVKVSSNLRGQAFARDGQHRLYLPASTIAGALRAWVRVNFNDQYANLLFGATSNLANKSGLVSIKDSLLPGVNLDKIFELRSGLRLNYHTACTTVKASYQWPVLAAGVKLPFYMQVELAQGKAELVTAVIAYLLDAAIKGELTIGAGSTRGLGKFSLIDLHIEQENWSTRAGLFAILNGKSPKLSLADLKKHSYKIKPQVKPRLDITIWFKTSDALMVHSDNDLNFINYLPLVTKQLGNKNVLVLPGSSIKGMLRSQAERIMRTLLSHNQANKILPSPLPIVSELFGCAREESKQAKAGQLRVMDCYSSTNFSAAHWRSLLETRNSASLQKVLNRLYFNKQGLRLAYRNAVDRWTGGSAGPLLHTRLQPLLCEWRPMQLQYDMSGLADSDNDNCYLGLSLLLLLMRDIYHHRMALGFGKNQGMGTIDVKQIKLTGHNLSAELAQLNRTLTVDRKLSRLKRIGFLQGLQQRWQTWLSTQLTDSV